MAACRAVIAASSWLISSSTARRASPFPPELGDARGRLPVEGGDLLDQELHVLELAPGRPGQRLAEPLELEPEQPAREQRVLERGAVLKGQRLVQPLDRERYIELLILGHGGAV